MTSKTVTSLAFAVGFVLALGAMPSAHAQYSPPMASPSPPELVAAPPQALGAMPSAQYSPPMASPSPPELVAAPPQALGAMPSAQYSPPMASPSPPELAAPMQQPYVGPPQVVTNAPQASPGDFGDWSAQRNNFESTQYDRLLQTNLGFRQARMRRECGPIADPQLRAQCLASFDQYEPVMTGSSPPPGWQYYPGAGQ